MFGTVLFETERAVSMMTAFEGLLDQAASQFQDAPAPEVSAELKPLADAILQLLQTRQYQEVISRSEQLLQEAQVRNDAVARLHALSYQAFALQKMNRLTSSASVYQQVRGVQPHTHGVAIASVSKYGGRKVLAQRHSPTDSLSRRASRSGRLDDLRHVPVETEQIRRLFGARVRLLRESQARPESVRTAAQQARVVHFACHAFADP
jgi:CHAT domain-containing protein